MVVVDSDEDGHQNDIGREELHRAGPCPRIQPGERSCLQPDGRWWWRIFIVGSFHLGLADRSFGAWPWRRMLRMVGHNEDGCRCAEVMSKVVGDGPDVSCRWSSSTWHSSEPVACGLCFVMVGVTRVVRADLSSPRVTVDVPVRASFSFPSIPRILPAVSR